jgi:ArsR family transcriptional regulator
MRILSLEELSVAELQEILDMGQSRISSHLALLRNGGLVMDRKDGKHSFYSLNERMPDPANNLLHCAFETVANQKDIQQDQQHLERILERRRNETERYFNDLAGRLGKKYCPGRSWEALGHLLLHLTPPIDIADLGAGEGTVSQLMARRARSVYCIDNAPGMVEFGSKWARENGLDNLTYKLGDIEKIPLADASVDLALFSQALHHARHPHLALKEAARILRPGGQVLILDLKEHTFEKAHELYADIWLGFSENRMYDLLKEAGFKKIEVTTVAREENPPHFETILARAETHA